MRLIDVIAGTLLILGALLSMMAGIAVLRFPDLMARTHAATKPQVLGTIVLMTGVGLRIGSASVIGLLILIVVLQCFTAPISAHLVVRAAYRRDVLGQVTDPNDITHKGVSPGVSVTSAERRSHGASRASADEIDGPPIDPADATGYGPSVVSGPE